MGVTRIPLHVISYGESGSGKSTFAQTFPKPMNVLMFDPIGKDMPYMRKGTPGLLVPSDDVADLMIRDVMSKQTPGKLLTRICYFGDADPSNPVAYSRFLAYMATFEYSMWATVVLDSVTFLELAARMDQKYRLNKSAKDPRQWWAGATDSLEELLMMRLGALPINVVVVAHVDEDKDELHGNFVRNPAAPGRLRKKLASGYGEFYRSFVGKDEDGNRKYLVQTAMSSQFNASSQINAPDPCEPNYKVLWSNFDTDAAQTDG